MWTQATRGRMAAIEKKTKRYPSDLTDEEWSSIESLLPRPAKRGRRRTTDLREVVNAIRYMVRSCCEWRMLPIHFPPRQTVYWWFRRFVRLLLFRTIHDLVLMIDRERAGREARGASTAKPSRRRWPKSGAMMPGRRLSALHSISRGTRRGLA